MNEQPITCTLPIDELNRRKSFELKELVEGSLRVQELENGYELDFPSDDAWFTNLTSFIATERRCCPFLHFELVILPDHAPLSMRVLGSAEVEEFVRGFLSQSVDLKGGE